jgi:hypothetical protein
MLLLRAYAAAASRLHARSIVRQPRPQLRPPSCEVRASKSWSDATPSALLAITLRCSDAPAAESQSVARF